MWERYAWAGVGGLFAASLAKAGMSPVVVAVIASLLAVIAFVGSWLEDRRG